MKFNDPSDRILIAQESQHHKLNSVHAGRELHVNSRTARMTAGEVPAAYMSQQLHNGISAAYDTSTNINTHENIPLQHIAVMSSAHV